MNREEVMAVRAAIDTTTKSADGITVFSLLIRPVLASRRRHNQPHDVRDRFVRLHGKGRKERAVPTKRLDGWLHEHVRTNKFIRPPIFANRQGLC
jgi:hypothetical protein